MSIGKLKKVPLREVWQHEAADFTTWLEENYEVLNDVLDFTLTGWEREQPVGDFSVDLVGEDEDGNTVVIENQLEPSNHRHLGQLLTYLAMLDAKAAVWIVAQARSEHAKVIGWLNEATTTPFYLIQLEAVQIEKSEPAPLLTKIVGPSEATRAAGSTKRSRSERHERRYRFWQMLLEEAKKTTTIHARISPSSSDSIAAAAGVPGLAWKYYLRDKETQVGLRIDGPDPDENFKLVDRLSVHKNEIESVFGEPLIWDRKAGRRVCRILNRIDKGGWRDEEKWPEVIATTVDAMCRLEKAIRPYLAELKGASV